MRRVATVVLAGLLSLSLLLGGTPSRSRASGTAGSLDTTFGSGGKVLTNLGQNQSQGPGNAVLQTNGDIVVSLDNPLGAVRYLPSGSLDASFGNAGVTLTGVFSAGSTVAIQPNGRIMVAGAAQPPNGQVDAFVVARFNENGSPDTSFGSGGEAFAPFTSTGTTSADAILVQPDGKILVGGSVIVSAYRGSTTLTAVARFNANGSLDTTFGSGGVVFSNRIGNVVTMGLDATGDIFLLNQGTIAELSPTGSFDASVIPATIVSSSHGGTDAFQSTGQYVDANTIFVVKGDTDVQVQRFISTGRLDPGFSSSAFDYAAQEARDGASALAIQSNGQIVVAGSHFFGTSGFGVARVSANGSLDTNFGSGGTLTTSFFGNDFATAAVIQGDGKIVVVGGSHDSLGNQYLVLARYLGSRPALAASNSPRSQDGTYQDVRSWPCLLYLRSAPEG